MFTFVGSWEYDAAVSSISQTGKGSFFGDFVYAQVVKRDHFLVALQKLFDWNALCGDLIKLYKGKRLRGRPPIDPSLVPPTGHLYPLRGTCTPCGAVEPFVNVRPVVRELCSFGDITCADQCLDHLTELDSLSDI